MKASPPKNSPINIKSSRPKTDTKSQSRSKSKGTKPPLTSGKSATKQPRIATAPITDENFFQSIIEQSSEGIALIDEKGYVIEWNQANEEITGLKRSEVLGFSYWDVAMKMTVPERRTPQNRERIKSMVLDALQTGRSALFERPIEGMLYTQPVKGKRFFHQTIFPVKTETGYRITSLTHDITERKLAEDTLREQEKYSQSLLRLSRELERSQTYADILKAAAGEVSLILGYKNIWVYLLSEDKKYFKVLSSTEDMSEEKTTGEGIATLTIEGNRMLEEIARANNIVVVEDARTDERTNKEIVAKLGNRTIINVPIFLHDKHLGSVGMGTFGDEGVRPPAKLEQEYLAASASHLAVAIDRIRLLAERKQAEEGMRQANLYNRSLIEASIDPLVTIGPNGKIMDVNKATEIVTGVSREHLIGDDFSNYFTEPAKANEVYQKVLIDGLVRDYPLTIQHISGKTTEVLYNATVYENKAGEIQGVFAAAHDITERKRAERALQQSEARFRKAIEAAGAVPYLHDYKTNTYSFIGNGILSLTGYSAQEITPALYGSLERDARMTGEAAQLSVRDASALMRAGQLSNWSYDGLVIARDGTKRWVADAAVPIFDETGKVTGSIGFLQDITERKLAEEEIRNANLYNRSLIEASIDPLVTIGPNGKITDVNTSTENITGLKREDLIGTDFSDYFTEPDKARNGYKKVFQDGLVRDYPLEIRHRNGYVTSVLYNATVYRDGKGNAVGVFAAARDITERKLAEQKLLKSEAKYRSLVEQMPSVVYLIPLKNKDQEYYLSPQIKQIGYTPEEMLADLNMWRKMIHPKDRSRVASFDHHQVSDEAISDEYRFFARDGRMIWVHEDYWTVRDETGQPLYIQGVCTDITNNKQAEEKLRSALNEKETLLREIHHRVKNNLQAIIALVNMRGKEIHDTNTRQFLKELEGQARTMSLVYEQLYQSENLSRVEMMPYIQQLTSNILQAFGVSREIDLNLNTTVSLDVSEAMPCGLIINELFTNSIKHAFPSDFKGIPAINIDLQQDGIVCRLTVSDNGVGLPPGLDWRSSRTFGLRLVNLWATHQMGGTLDVSGAPGTTFTINFEIQSER